MIHSFLLVLHVISGTAALGGGLTAIIARKSKGLHTRAGSVYYLGMYGVAVTGVAMTLMKFNPFLLAIGLFSFYLTFTGKRFIEYYRRREIWKALPSDLVPGYVAVAVAVFMIVWPLVQMLYSKVVMVPVLAVFGLILLLNAVQDIRALKCTENLVPRNRRFLLMHIGKMGGAYIATVTAFLVNNVQTNPGWIAWLLPTIIGSPMIASAIRNWKHKLRLA
jgi:uncharacterized membrane protein